MAFSSQPPGEKDELYTPLAEINVTPFIDVMLVLLIIFMVTAPMLASGMNVDLPKAASAQPLQPKEPIILAIDDEKRIFLGKEEIARDKVVARVKAELGEPARVVHVRGDKAAQYGDVVGLLDELAAAGITRLSIITRTAPKAP
jgi:biopolymer transport protein ExbD/biopolymer transport protein TolR